MSNIELNGEWWLPESDIKISGTLYLSGDQGIYLSLIGVFEAHWVENIIYPIIRGRTKDKNLTLFNCDLVKTSFGTNYPSSEYSISYVFEGNHFSEDIDNLLLSKISVNFSYLSNWGTLSTVKCDEDNGAFTFRVQKHEDIKITLDKASLIIRQIPISELSRYRLFIELKALIELEFQEPISLPQIYAQYLTPLQFFVSLLTTRFNQIISVNCFNDESDCKIFHKNFKFNGNVEVLHPTKNFFGLHKIKDNLQNIMNCWFDLYRKAPDLMNLYFSIEENSKILYLENQFLFIVQFLEGYYKRVENPQKQNSSLQTIIRYFFNEQLNLFILDKFSQALCSSDEDTIVNSSKKRLLEKISKGIEDTRNYYSHYGHIEKSTVLTGTKLFRVTQMMNFLVKSVLLNKLELPDANNRIERDAEFQYFLINIKSFDLLS